MLIEIYDNGQMFLEKHEAVMLERESESQLILHNAYKKRGVEASNTNLFGAIISDEGPEILFCNVAPYNLVLYTVKRSEFIESSVMDEATKTLGNYLITMQIPIKGINGNYDSCQGLINYYKANSSFAFQRRLVMDIMEVRELTDITQAEGKTRLGTEDDKLLVTDWLIQFDLEALSSETDYEQATKLATKLIENNSLYLLEDSSGKVVSMASTIRKLKNGSAISRIYTSKEERGKGYAMANLYNITESCLQEGSLFCTLFSDKESPMNVKSYKTLGYKVVNQQYEYNILSLEG